MLTKVGEGLTKPIIKTGGMNKSIYGKRAVTGDDL